MVRENEYRPVVWRVIAPPALPAAVTPIAPDGAEHVPAHDVGADIAEPLLDDLGAGVDLAALLPVGLTPDLQREHPAVEIAAALADRVLLALVRPGDVAVERDRDVGSHRGHAAIDRSCARNSSPRPLEVSEQVSENSRRGPPDQLVRDQVGIGLDRHPTANEAPPCV